MLLEINDFCTFLALVKRSSETNCDINSETVNVSNFEMRHTNKIGSRAFHSTGR
jgi:hypothetical protein